ncbi:amidohydrolase family protein [Amycolatopsis sp. NPDC050768]|uniref:amidohydrolase family protein n=1 Tax=Amycolatopsis sp. NPDC050768 TaxID=3154839 RepID=UPI0033DD64F9
MSCHDDHDTIDNTVYDLVIKSARVVTGETPIDIGISRGVVCRLAPDLAGRAALDAGGNLVTPGFVDTHLHLDKSRLMPRYRHFDGTLASAITETAELKKGFTEDDVYQRAEQTLRDCVTHGTTRIRTQVEVDDVVSLKSFHAINALADDWRDYVDVEVCVFAQEGLTQSEETKALLDAALAQGAPVLGGAPYADVDPLGQLDWIFERAQHFEVPIDLHLDLAETTGGMLIEEVCRRTIQHGMQGRVTVGHVTQLSFVTPERFAELTALAVDADLAFTVLPATDLFLMGRATSHSKPRGVLDMKSLIGNGLRCSVATNNVLNAFTPYGDGSLIRMANLYANITHLSGEGLEQAFSLVTDGAARVVDPGSAASLVEGAPADLICLPTDSGANAVATISEPLWGLKHGRLTFTRLRPVLQTPPNFDTVKRGTVDTQHPPFSSGRSDAGVLEL